MSVLAAGLVVSCAPTETAPKETDADLRFYTEGLPFEIGAIARPKIDSYVQLITDFGGVGDGITDNTEAFSTLRKIKVIEPDEARAEEYRSAYNRWKGILESNLKREER